MKAIVQHRYGSPDHLTVDEMGKPVAREDSAVVRVHAASVNALDWRTVRGSPWVVRVEGLRKPKQRVRGVDAAGVVEEVGRNVSDLRPGDEVFGVGTGSFAEYVSGTIFAPKPANLTFEEAAAVPVAGSTAIQAIRDKGRVRPGERVLVNGAGGGVGTFVVQIAKAFGAEVTAVSTSEKAGVLRSIGADRVLDRRRQSFTEEGERYDVIVDIGGGPSFGAFRRALKVGGRVVVVGAKRPLGRMLGGFLRGRVLRQPFIPFVSWESTQDLVALKDLIEAGAVRPVIDRTYPLSRTAEAIHLVESGSACGKVVIAVLEAGDQRVPGR